MEKTAHPTYAHCPIRHIVDRFGDKWSLLVLYNLHTSGCLRFSEIHRRTADISQKMLTSTLRKLEQDGCCRARSTPRYRPAWNMRSRPAASRSCPTSQRLSGGQRKISTPSSKTGSGKRYSDGQGLPGKSSGYPRTAPCRQPVGKTLSADSKIRTLPQRATGNAHPRNRRPASKTAGASRPPPEMRPQRHRLAATRSASGT